MGENEGRAHVLISASLGLVLSLLDPICEAFGMQRHPSHLRFLTFCNTIHSTWDSLDLSSPPTMISPTAGSEAGWLLGFLERFQNSTTKISSDFIHKSLHESDERRMVKCFIYDCDLHWAYCKATGVVSVAFITQKLGSTAAYYMLNLKVHCKNLNVTALDIPDFSDTGVSDVVDGPGLDRISPVLRVTLSKFDNFGKADMYFCHTFEKMEHEALEWMKNICPTIATIGPVVPSAYLDNRMEDNIDYGLNMNKLDRNTCLEWLNTKEPNFVVYVAYGSMVDTKLEEIKEMAMALKNRGCNFLWVMKETEMPNLPSDLTKETSEKGMFVRWCPQLQVLSHPAVGYMVTHCGANSVMEAIVFEVPMVGMPRFVDQIPNAYFVEEVWKVGVNLMKNEEGVCSKEEIERCLKEVMYEQKGKDIKKNFKELNKYAKEAVSEGGSSDKNIEYFVSGM